VTLSWLYLKGPGFMMCRLDLASYWAPSQGAKEMDLCGHTFTRQVDGWRLPSNSWDRNLF
jgi:hypothetical protein